jgi:EPS-associated MarR family transcriptional regulator
MVDYHLLREIQQNPAHTQRSLADSLGISLGKANYLLAGLAEKGIVKARKLRNHPKHIRWQYVLTPKGISEKLRVARDYLSRREHEFEQMQREIAELRSEVAGSEPTVPDAL